MRPHFEGWYFKHQQGGKTLALIPGRAEDGAFIQVVTDERAWNVPLPESAYHAANPAWVGRNRFSKAGVQLDLQTPEITLTGGIRFGVLTPLRYDIMGPFSMLPMECRHRVMSMRHSLTGSLCLNGENLDFTGGTGYIEGDAGRSFPERYTWVQCNAFDMPCSVMASVARIPVGGHWFWGCICVVWLAGREYRLATYNGGYAIVRAPNQLVLRRGAYRLEVDVLEQKGHPLAAPGQGRMVRTIHESPACAAHFRFTKGNTVIFEETSTAAGYEYVE